MHTHPCSRCGKQAPCHGRLERNYDGFPPVICAGYHETPVSYLDFECEDCALVDQWCEECGEHPAIGDDNIFDDMQRLFGDYCQTCAQKKLDNYDGAPMEAETDGWSAGERMQDAYRMNREQK